MDPLIKLLNSVPGIEESDDVVLRLPWELYETFGEDSYRQIANHLLDPKTLENCPNLAVVLRELPYCTDGVPESFLKWCIDNCDALLDASVPFEAASYACLRWDSVWGSDSWHQKRTAFLNLVSPWLRRADDTELRELEGYVLEQSELFRRATRLLEEARIVVTRTLVSNIVARDNSLTMDRLGLSSLEAANVMQALAACLLKNPKSKIGNALYRSTFEVCSRVQPNRVVVDAEWMVRGDRHELQDVFWGGDANHRRRELWGNSEERKGSGLGHVSFPSDQAADD
ncbi:hypothetical protein [Roseiconus lacunae]|uniref:hypothetical protein n=1 Tax=Roseiconus lacunae TaxID=2605694 RepID=UPI001E513056|nr:hypothetical protein [Roseiconus lacunae]MCD0458584.1 hypothetical protein [Roseiconus lacunae]